jgi:hypothetical protein
MIYSIYGTPKYVDTEMFMHMLTKESIALKKAKENSTSNGSTLLEESEEFKHIQEHDIYYTENNNRDSKFIKSSKEDQYWFESSDYLDNNY